MYKDIFIQLGLSLNEAIIYEYLLKKGETTAGDIIKNTPLKRGVVYNTLDSLEKKALISEKGILLEKRRAKISHFSPNHPEKLREYAKQKDEELKKAERNLEANMSKIISDFNLVSDRPGIRYFEGLKGIKKVIDDTLTTKDVIYTYADAESVVRYINKINQEYVKKRDALGLEKRIILEDNSFSRKYMENYHLDTTDYRFIDQQKSPFTSVMQIYDGKISYITLTENSQIGVIIEDQSIFKMHKALFEFTWDKASLITKQ